MRTFSPLHILSSRANMTERFPLERIGNWTESTLHIVLTACLPACLGGWQSEKHGAGGKVTFFNFARNRSKMAFIEELVGIFLSIMLLLGPWKVEQS